MFRHSVIIDSKNLKQQEFDLPLSSVINYAQHDDEIVLRPVSPEASKEAQEFIDYLEEGSGDPEHVFISDVVSYFESRWQSGDTPEKNFSFNARADGFGGGRTMKVEPETARKVRELFLAGKIFILPQ